MTTARARIAAPSSSASRYGCRVAVEGDDGARDREPGAELLRLHLRPAGERLAADAGGKAEVVLDLRARAGLAAGGDAFEDDRLQSLRGAVDRGGEPGRAGADDGEVEHRVVVEVLGDAERVGELGERRVAQRPMPRQHDHRQLGRGQREALEEAAGIGVLLGVEQAQRVGVAVQELLQAQGVGAVRRTDQHRRALPVAEQADPAQDEGAHDDLGDVGLALHQAAEVGAA